MKDIIIWEILEKVKRGEKDEGNNNPRISQDTPVLTQIFQDRLSVQTVYRLKRMKINLNIYDFNLFVRAYDNDLLILEKRHIMQTHVMQADQ